MRLEEDHIVDYGIWATLLQIVQKYLNTYQLKGKGVEGMVVRLIKRKYNDCNQHNEEAAICDVKLKIVPLYIE